MKGRQCELDMTKMSVALLQSQTTSIATSILTRDAHTRIKGSMMLYSALASQVEEVPVAYLKDRLIQDILARASNISFVKLYVCPPKNPRNTKSQFLYSLRYRVDDLLFYSPRSIWRLYWSHRHRMDVFKDTPFHTDDCIKDNL